VKGASATAAPTTVTVVTQTRAKPDRAEEFAAWQQKIGEAAAASAGFISQSVLPPSPPAQADWVILQRFASAAAATDWLDSARRLELLTLAQPLLVGRDDVHIVPDGASGVLPAPVSAVITTRVKPGCEERYRAWEQRIAAVQARAPGFQGYRFEPPAPGVQNDWLAIVRFDSEANLDAWLNSPARLTLVEESAAFTDEVHARIVRSGFDQWFPNAPGRPRPAVWKQNMLVLLMLYPVVFVFGALVQSPLLVGHGMPFWLALFIGNVVSVTLLNWLVPWSARRFGWWITPQGASVTRINIIGAGAVVGLYIVCLLAFALYSNWPLARQ
jgi:uncharacterized protein